MPLPNLTALQFLALESLSVGELPGRELRGAMQQQTKIGLTAFYRLMSRLEEAGFVDGWYVTKSVDGQTVRERRYKLTGDGRQAVESTRVFYAADALGGLSRA